jgi:tetratricopeptide (TPR) repeat protein
MLVRGFAVLALLVSSATAGAGGPTTQQQRDEAAALATRGLQHFDAKEYGAAIEAFRAAYALDPDPKSLYNLAQALRLGGNCGDAIATYQAFLRTNPDPQGFQAAQINIEQCRAQPGGKKPPTEEAAARLVEPPPARPVRRGRPLRVAAFTTGASTVASIVLAGAMYGWAAADRPARKSYCAALPRDCVPSEWSDLTARQNASYALFAVAGALAVADVVLWTFDLKRRR